MPDVLKFDPKWWQKRHDPENLCANCGHSRSCHLGEAYIKGEPKVDDSGWCTLPMGTCIFKPCECKTFVEPVILAADA